MTAPDWRPSIGDGDIKPLFDLAEHFDEEILKLQSDETAKWVTEFSSGVALLGELIKSQRESSEKGRRFRTGDFRSATKRRTEGRSRSEYNSQGSTGRN